MLQCSVMKSSTGGWENISVHIWLGFVGLVDRSCVRWEDLLDGLMWSYVCFYRESIWIMLSENSAACYDRLGRLNKGKASYQKRKKIIQKWLFSLKVDFLFIGKTESIKDFLMLNCFLKEEPLNDQAPTLSPFYIYFLYIFTCSKVKNKIETSSVTLTSK